MATTNTLPVRPADELAREQALARRWKRQQGELFEVACEPDFPECPNCGEHAQPVYGISEDPSCGYHAEEQACMACLPRRF